MKRSIQISILLISIFLSNELYAQNAISPYLDVQGPLYTRENIYSLNKAGNGWIPWAARNTSLSETKIDLSNINNAFFSGSVGIGMDPSWSGYKLAVYNPGDRTGVVIGNTATGLTALLMGTNADANGYGYFQAIKSSGSSYGNIIMNENGGNVGIGITSPSAKLHVMGTGSNVNADNNNIISGDLVIQSNTGGRYQSKGAQLEFVIPANTDGSNLWGQGRIITVAGNSSSGSATGKMILGTRRYFDKGAGQGWNYGDDIVIDGTGNVGIGTKMPDALLAVRGSIHAQEVKVDLNVPGPDYVFETSYKLPALDELNTYIKINKHLPEVPSACAMEENGVKLGEMNMLLLKKVEELTLYMIELKKENESIKQTSEELVKQNSELSKRVLKLEKN